MSVVVKNNFIKRSPQKIRLMADLIRNKPVQEALKILRFSPKKDMAIELTKLINSGLAIALASEKYDLDNLSLSTIKVDEGRTMKRISPRAQGRAFRIRKRTSKVVIELKEA